MSQLKAILKKEAVFCISLLLALISAFFVPPDAEYLTYIDYKTIALLFCLMLISAGLSEYGVFRSAAEFLTKRAGGIRALAVVLLAVCFFGSMLITNDVALITFVPFTLFLFRGYRNVRTVIRLVVLETIAANLGSMATPIGNPQNLYLYSAGGFSAGEFMAAVLPYAALSLIMLAASAFVFRDEGERINFSQESELCSPPDGSVKTAVLFALLLLSVLAVLRVVSYIIAFFVTAAAVVFLNRRLFARVDYYLLLTFVFFFVFIGNMKRIPEVTELLTSLVAGNELIVGVAASQIISNVPAAILLSGFCEDMSALVTGVNLGGLGTLIASMASLISFKFFAAEHEDKKGSYIMSFTLWNVAFLAVLTAEAALIGAI